MSHSTGLGAAALLVLIAACQPAAKTETTSMAGVKTLRGQRL